MSGGEGEEGAWIDRELERGIRRGLARTGATTQTGVCCNGERCVAHTLPTCASTQRGRFWIDRGLDRGLNRALGRGLDRGYVPAR